MVQHRPDRVASASRRAWVRDAGIVRLRRLTGIAIAAATALSGIFAGLAASAAPGRKVVHTTSRADPPSAPLRVARAPGHRSKPKPVSKPAPQTQSAPAATPAPAPTTTRAAAPPPAPPPAPPVTVPQQAPVIVSGGS